MNPKAKHSPSLTRRSRIIRKTISQPLSILLVADNLSERRKLRSLIQHTCGQQANISECESGLVALEMLRRTRIDVVLIDYLLPDMNGLQLVSDVADMSDDTAVILLSDGSSCRVAADAIKHGARDYLDKRELNPATLESAMVEALRTARLEWRLSRSHHGLRAMHEEIRLHVGGVSSEITSEVDELKRSIDDLEQSEREAGAAKPIRQILEQFTQVQHGLRRSLQVLQDLASRGEPCIDKAHRA